MNRIFSISRLCEGVSCFSNIFENIADQKCAIVFTLFNILTYSSHSQHKRNRNITTGQENPILPSLSSSRIMRSFPLKFDDTLCVRLFEKIFVFTLYLQLPFRVNAHKRPSALTTLRTLKY